ncbi:MAG: tetratricopeptide repeat protein [Polyangiales bacterium]
MNRWIAPCALTLLIACEGSCGGAPEASSSTGPESAQIPSEARNESTQAPAEAPNETAETGEATEAEATEADERQSGYDADAHQRYLELLAEGRRATRARRYPDGIRALEGALEVDPGDGPALGELGWALFHAGRLDEASARTQEALASTYDSRRRAMLLYNMGRIAEASNGPEEAAANLYQASLMLRPSTAVADRLRANGGDADFTDETRSLAQRLSTSVGSLMDQESPCPEPAAGDEEDEGDDDGDDYDYEEDMECDVVLVEGSSPELQWMLVTTTTDAGSTETVYSLWARTRTGLYEIGALTRDWRGMWGGEMVSGSVELTLAQLVAGGPMELVATAEEGGEDPDWCEGWAGDTRITTLCGLGAGDVPVCWAHLTTYQLSYTTLGRVGDLLENGGGDEDDEDIARCDVTPARIAAAEEAVNAANEVADHRSFGVDVADDGSLVWDENTPPSLARIQRAAELSCLLPNPHAAFGCAPDSDAPE